MKTIKIIFKTALVLILILMIGISGVGYYALHHPHEVWALIEKKFLPKDLEISWDDLKFEASPQSARLWRPSLEARNLCLRKKQPSIEFCFDELKVQSEISLQQILSPRFEIQSLYGLSTHQNHFLPSSEKEKKNQPEMNFHEMAQSYQQKLKKYSVWLKANQVNLAVNHFELRSTQSTPLVIRVLLRSQELLDSAHVDLAMEKDPNLFLQTQGEVSLQKWIAEQGQIAKLSVQVEHPKAKVQFPEVLLDWDEKANLIAHLDGSVKMSQITLKNKLDAKLSSQALTADLQAIVLGLKKPFHHLKPIQVSMELPQERAHLWPRNPASYKASSLLPVFFVDAKMRPLIERACKCKLPEELAVNLDGKAFLKKYFSDEDGEITNLEARVQSLTNSLFTTNASMKLAVAREKNEFRLAPYIDSQFILNSFQGLALALRAQKILVPAPLANLDGTITLTVRGPVERSVENWKIPFLAQTDLNSPQQRVDITSQGFVDVRPEARWVEANIDVLLRNVTLQLPPLDPVYGVPKITPDKRIEVSPLKVAKKSSQKQKFNFRMALHVRSQKPDSLRLLYPLAKPYIPVDLKLDFETGSSLKGQIALSPFQVEYLRRRSTIEKFQLALNQPTGAFPVQGRFRVDQSQYKIYIDILGNLKTPQFVLSSDPYLDRADIISVLLYGRTNDQLVGMDAKTVGSFDAAMADRAIGLIGLWAFSSTPIQSFSYNQLSKQYSAQLKVTDDTSLAVGTNWEQATSLELQKRLSQHWMVSASMEPTEEDQQTRKIRLQWEDRF